MAKRTKRNYHTVPHIRAVRDATERFLRPYTQSDGRLTFPSPADWYPGKGRLIKQLMELDEREMRSLAKIANNRYIG